MVLPGIGISCERSTLDLQASRLRITHPVHVLLASKTGAERKDSGDTLVDRLEDDKTASIEETG